MSTIGLKRGAEDPFYCAAYSCREDIEPNTIKWFRAATHSKEIARDGAPPRTICALTITESGKSGNYDRFIFTDLDLAQALGEPFRPFKVSAKKDIPFRILYSRRGEHLIAFGDQNVKVLNTTTLRYVFEYSTEETDLVNHMVDLSEDEKTIIIEMVSKEDVLDDDSQDEDPEIVKRIELPFFPFGK